MSIQIVTIDCLTHHLDCVCLVIYSVDEVVAIGGDADQQLGIKNVDQNTKAVSSVERFQYAPPPPMPALVKSRLEWQQEEPC